MNIAKNMEAIFIAAAALALIGGSSLASASPAAYRAAPTVATTVAAVVAGNAAVPMAVVHVHAKRLSALDKAALAI